MRIPRFWAVTEGSGVDEERERFLYRRVWGWSMSSAADALAVAGERLQTVLAELRSGTKVGSYYPRVPLREPILEEVTFGGEQVLVVTRNRYGAEVLNTDQVLIADVDLPELEDERAPSSGWKFWRRQEQHAVPAEPAVVTDRLAVLASWAAANANRGVIVYRTRSGLRVFVTGVAEPATSAQGQDILTALDSDPIYRELCRAHGTFRARLTPKPWRMPGMKAPRGRWPYPPGRAERRFQRWLGRYEEASAGYAVCRRLAAYGLAPSLEEQRVLELHDRRTKVDTPLPLA